MYVVGKYNINYCTHILMYYYNQLYGRLFDRVTPFVYCVILCEKYF